MRCSPSDAENLPDLVLGRGGELGQVGRLVRDLRARRRDEMVEEPSRDVSLLWRQRLDRPLEVVGDDLARTTEPRERRGAEGRGALRALDVPQPLHDELQVRRLDSRWAAVPTLGARAAQAQLDPSCPDAVEDVSDELVLDRHGVTLELGPALERLHDRRATRRTVEVIQAQHVSEQVWDRALEPIEGGERVLAERQQHVDA